MIQLYAITDSSAPPLPDVGSLRTIASGELAAVCAPATEAAVTPELLWRHEQVVEALMDDRDVLPVRYGTRVPDETSVARILEQEYERLAERLEFVRGAAEVSVRAFAADCGSIEPAAGQQPMTGGDYLRGRARELASEREAARAIHEPLTALARAVRQTQTGFPHEVLRAAYLLDDADVAAFGELVVKLQAANPTLQLVCTGPWPPYSFAER